MSVKRLLIMMLLALCMAPSPAWAEEGRPLYAVKDKNGLWGFIDCKGNLVMPGTFTWAKDFRGDYALARQDGSGRYGIINAQGEWILPPVYEDIMSVSDSGEMANVYLVIKEWKKGEKQGFFDIPSGFFSGLIYDTVHIEWTENTDSEYIGVSMDGKLGFASRTTGEIVIPCQYSPDDCQGFSGDYCMVMPYDATVADGWILIDRQGREVPLPENCYAASTFSDGLAAVWDSVRDLCGYIDTAGNVVLEPQYLSAYAFSEGLACVRLQTGEWAMIAPDGGIAFTRLDEADASLSSAYCSHGLIRCALPDGSTVVYCDREGNEKFRLHIDGLSAIGDFKENGVAFYEVYGSSDNSYNFKDGYGVGLINDRGEVLTRPIFYVPDWDWRAEYAEGLFRITEISTLKEGYIDERGRWAFRPVNGYCRDFRDGLARIDLYPDVIFVDRKGKELYRFALNETKTELQ